MQLQGVLQDVTPIAVTSCNLLGAVTGSICGSNQAGLLQSLAITRLACFSSWQPQCWPGSVPGSQAATRLACISPWHQPSWPAAVIGSHQAGLCKSLAATMLACNPGQPPACHCSVFGSNQVACFSPWQPPGWPGSALGSHNA
jgi:hypothetical protein